MEAWRKYFKRTMWHELRRRFYIGGPEALAAAIADRRLRRDRDRKRTTRDGASRADQLERERQRSKLRRSKNPDAFREYDRNRARVNRAATRRFTQACAQISVLKQIGQLGNQTKS